MLVGRMRSSVRELAAYRPGKAASHAEEEHGITNAIKLASNENPWTPLPAVVEAMTEALHGINRYADHRATAVREALADWLEVDIDHVTVGCGSSALLQQIMLTYVEAGDEVVFPWPSFEVYPVYCTIAGATQVRVELRDYAFDLDAVAAAVTDRTKVVILATPNNPTGTAISTGELAGLLALIPDDVMVVADEAYREFNDRSLGDPLSELLPTHPNLILTRTLSKAFGLAGIRIGYAIADPDVIVGLDKVLLPFSVNGVAQAAAVAAIAHRDEALERVKILCSERDRVASALADAGWPVPKSRANFVFIATGEQTDSIALSLEKAGIVTRPFSGFGIRITIGTPEQNDRWLTALSQIARINPHAGG